MGLRTAVKGGGPDRVLIVKPPAPLSSVVILQPFSFI